MYNFLAQKYKHMWEALLLITVTALPWHTSWQVSWTGLPLMSLVLGLGWCLHVLPLSVYTHGYISLVECTELVVLTDVIQFGIHLATHKGWLGRRLAHAHAIHHKAQHPTPDDAFHTGILDAIVQLLVPLYLAIHMVQPNRSTVTFFGLAYSQWLLYIHSDTSAFLPKSLFASPEYHKGHHLRPQTHYAHVFTILDRWV